MRDPQEGLTHESGWIAGRRLGDALARVTAAVGLERWSRLVAVALVPVFFQAGTAARVVPLYTALVAYVLITSFAPRNRYLRAADLLAATVLIAAAGGETVPFLPFLMVVVAGPSARGGFPAGLASGGTLAIVLTATYAATDRLGEAGASEVLPLALLLLLTGVTTAAAVQVQADQRVTDRRVLQEANRLLSALRDLADDIPGGLDVTTVAGALVAEARELSDRGDVLVYALDEGVYKPVAATGIGAGALPTLRVDELRGLARPEQARLWPRSRLPAGLSSVCAEHLWWAVVGMYREGALLGALLVGVDDADVVRRARPRLLALAGDGALALQNAQLFDGTHARATDAARRHVAGDLHDSVAQSLAHLRMELELLAMTSPEPDGGEIGRLARVARGALEDLRATIAGLRSPGHDDLASALRRHLEYVDGERGPTIELDCAGDTRLDAAHGDEVLRVAQEAVSNALRHAGASTIRVDLECDEQMLRLVVEDDGDGIDGPSARAGGGVGIRSMRERAQRLGGHLEIRARAGGGTVVDLRCPSPVRPSTESSTSPPATLPGGDRPETPGALS